MSIIVDEDPDKNGLVICSYEMEFCVDICTAYAFEVKRKDEIVDGTFFEFMMEPWNLPINQARSNINEVEEVTGMPQSWEKEVKEIISEKFPFFEV
eukprot:15358356-Ditylum_brightwellii.AAC.1